MGEAKAAVYPATLWQTFLLDQGTHPDCSDDLRDRWILPNAFLIYPGIDVRRVKRAIEKLFARHDSLRIRLQRTKDVWQARIVPASRIELPVIDLGDMSDDCFRSEICQIAYDSMPLVDHPLVQFVVAKCGQRGDVLVMRVHHAISDGHGMVVLIEDLLKALIELPFDKTPISHADYIKRFQAPLPSRAKEIEAFWQDLHADLPEGALIGRAAKGNPSIESGFGEVDQRRLVCTASAQSLRKFEAKMVALNFAAATAISAAYLEAICDCLQLQRVLWMVHLGRADPALDAYIGDHTMDPVLPYSACGAGHLEKAIQQVGDLISQARMHLPSDAAHRGTPYERDLNARAGYRVKFAVSQPRPTLREGRSIFKDGFNAGLEMTQEIGSYTLTPLDLSLRRRKTQEMQLDLVVSHERQGFKIHYDGFSFSNAEVQKIAETMCTLLELRATRVELS